MRVAVGVEFVQELDRKDQTWQLGGCEDFEGLGFKHEQD